MTDKTPETPENDERPLVTFALFAYNQEKFIREAVEGAIAQTYSPLQIILSDDCSSDQTFEIIQKVAQGYQGPHDITLNRNSTNLGVSSHVNKINDLAKGRLIVAAAGDDISLPHRVSTLARAWIGNDKPAALCSDAIYIDEHGNTLSEGFTWWPEGLPKADETTEESLLRYIFNKECGLYGCAEAWNKSLFEYFGPLPPGLLGEDPVLSLRAWLFDRIVFLPDMLVRYRVHDSNIWGRKFIVDRSIAGYKKLEERATYLANGELGILQAHLEDLHRAWSHKKLSTSLLAKLTKEVSRRMKITKVRHYWWKRSLVWKLTFGLRIMAVHGRKLDFNWAAQRLFPFPIFLFLRSTASRAWNLVRVR